MRRFAVLCTIAACSGDDGALQPVSPDAHVPSGEPTMPADPPAATIVQIAHVPATTGTTFSIPLTPTGEGNLVVIALAVDGATGQGASSIVTPGGRRFTADTFSFAMYCPRGLELWSLRDVETLTSVDVHLAESTTATAYAIEVAGLSGYPLVHLAGNGAYDLPVMDAPLMVAPGELVLGGFIGSGTVAGLAADSSFTALGVELGSAVAYTIATRSEPLSARWQYDGGFWSQRTVAYR